MKWVLLIIAILCMATCGIAESNAKSIMHEIYGGVYGIIGALFFCTCCLIEFLEKYLSSDLVKKTKETKKNKSIEL